MKGAKCQKGVHKCVICGSDKHGEYSCDRSGGGNRKKRQAGGKAKADQ